MMRIVVQEVGSEWVVEWFSDDELTHRMTVRKKEITSINGVIAQLRNASSTFGAKVKNSSEDNHANLG